MAAPGPSRMCAGAGGRPATCTGATMMAPAARARVAAPSSTSWPPRLHLIAGGLALLARPHGASGACTLEAKECADLRCGGGAACPWTQPGAKPVPLQLRSGFPHDHSVCSVVKPSAEAINRLEVELGYIVGYDTQAPPPPDQLPVLSIMVHNTPDPTAPGAQQVYTSPPLSCDKHAKRHCYATCGSLPKHPRKCFSPTLSVDVECKHCTGKFVSIRFDNRAQNLQLLLPVTLEINRSKLEEAASLTIDIAALCAVAYMTVYAMVNVAVHGKRGWHIIPHADHVRGLGGLVFDGVIFSATLLGCRRGKGVHHAAGREPLLKGGAAGLQTKLAAGGAGAEVVVHAGKSSRKRQATPIHRAVSSGDSAGLRSLLSVASKEAIDAGDEQGYTALHVAASSGHVPCAKLLLQAGCATSLRNGEGMTAWDIASSLGHEAVLQLKHS